MKKLRIFAFIGIIAMLFSACSKDEEFTIIGIWNVDKVTTTYYEDGVVVETETELNAGKFEFKNDGVGIITVEGQPVAFTYTLSGNSLTIGAFGFQSVFTVTKKEPKSLHFFIIDEDEYGEEKTEFELSK